MGLSGRCGFGKCVCSEIEWSDLLLLGGIESLIHIDRALLHTPEVARRREKHIEKEERDQKTGASSDDTDG